MIRCSTEQRDHVLIDGVSKSYDGTSFVVEDLHLRVPKGEFITLLGPSGSGKTTTLMMLAGFEYPTSGRIILDGRSIESTPPEKRNIGIVASGGWVNCGGGSGSNGLPPGWSGRAYYRAIGRAAGVAAARAQTKETCA